MVTDRQNNNIKHTNELLAMTRSQENVDSINKTVNHINLVLLFTCETNNWKIGYSGEIYSMAMITSDMIISKDAGYMILLLKYQFK